MSDAVTTETCNLIFGHSPKSICQIKTNHSVQSFHTCVGMTDRWADGYTDQWMERWNYWWKGGWTEEQKDGVIDKWVMNDLTDNQTNC